MAQTQQVRGVATGVTGRGTDHIAVQYHDTTVATLRDHTIVTLNSGGYYTNTTRTRINQFANEFCNGAFRLVQRKGEWMIEAGRGRVFDFFDGITFHIGASDGAYPSYDAATAPPADGQAVGEPTKRPARRLHLDNA